MRKLPLLVLLLLPVWAGSAAADTTQRPMRVQDMFEIEQIGTYHGGNSAFAPDGRAFAFTRVRAKKTLANHKWEFLWGNAGADVWLQAAPGAEPANLTNGASDSSGWWMPDWSPDGRYLALLSTRGGNVRLWVWDSKSGDIRQLTDHGVKLVVGKPCGWADSKRIVCPLLAKGEQPWNMVVEVTTPQRATAAWGKAPAGREVTASVLSSGVPVDLSQRPQGHLALIDVETGQSSVIARGNIDQWAMAPDGQAVAYTRQVTAYTPRAGEELRFDSMSGRFTVEVVDLQGRTLVAGAALSADVLTDSVRWSPDSAHLVFLGFGASRNEAPRLFWYHRAMGKTTALTLGELDAAPVIRKQPQLEWTAAGELLVLAAKMADGKRPAVTDRRDWWLVGRDGASRLLTESLENVPEQLFVGTERRMFVGLADDELVGITPKGEVRALTAGFGPQVRHVVWPYYNDRGTMELLPRARARDRLIFSTYESAQPADYYLLDLASGAIQPLPKPAAEATLMAYASATGSAVFAEQGRNGTFVRRTSRESEGVDELMAANNFLRAVAEGEFRLIEYTSLNGEKLKGRLILPVGYEAGKRYPLLTWVYAGAMITDAPPSSHYRIGSVHALSLQIPAAQGYAVLMPSMPLKPEGQTDDPMLRLPEGVLPAVDKVVELGIADPERLFLAGQSFGGYSTYGLVTQTHRFKAAVALAGLSNLISLYGVFDARYRYLDQPHENLFAVTLSEGGQIRMGGAPWEDAGRYLRNSPIFYVDRVQTPLMIVQGDMDYVAMQQGEEFFMSLYRQGKRAQFVRYWGEGHVLQGPANIVDFWQRIFAWFEEFTPRNE